MDFYGKRYIFFVLSLVIMATGLGFYFANDGFKYGIEFSGGAVFEFEMEDNTFKEQDAIGVAKESINKEVTVLRKESEVLGKYYLVINVSEKQRFENAESVIFEKAIKDHYKAKFKAGSEVSKKNVDPSIGADLKAKSGWAVFWSALLIILYIAIRFRIMNGWSAGVIAIIGLIHDICIMLSVYTIFNLAVDESFIAAILTIMGYSMNDTIIIYDRIRENSKISRKLKVEELVNTSIVQTLARSINTVLTVLICLVSVYVFASYYNIDTVKVFTLPLIIGITSGGYSSIFISSPLYVMWQKHIQKMKANRRKIATAK